MFVSQTAQHEAKRMNNICLKAAVSQPQNKDGRTLLHTFVDTPEFVHELLENGAKVNVCDNGTRQVRISSLSES